MPAEMDRASRSRWRMSTVARRSVFYVSGFDPKGASHYHALYKEQGSLESRRDGWQLDVGPRRKQASGNPAWSVDADIQDRQVQTHYEFMRWDDVVRNHWPKTTAALWRDVIATTFFYLRHGTLWKMFCLSWPPAVALFAPFLLVCFMLLGIPFFAVAAGLALGEATGLVAAGVAGAAALAAVLWAGARRLEARYSMYWMMRSYAFTALQARGRVPDLEVRLDELAARLVVQVEAGQDDEVLVVGHSSGAIMAASIVARALTLSPGLLQGRSKLSLLTLGQWIPLLGLLPMAHAFRGELAVLGQTDKLTWVDFSAPPDGCCFALVDPLAACGVARPDGAGVQLKILNPRFATRFDPARYARLKRDKFAMHFQYLHAADLPGDYSYFQITAGPVFLGERFASTAGVVGYSGLRPFR